MQTDIPLKKLQRKLEVIFDDRLIPVDCRNQGFSNLYLVVQRVTAGGVTIEDAELALEKKLVKFFRTIPVISKTTLFLRTPPTITEFYEDAYWNNEEKTSFYVATIRFSIAVLSVDSSYPLDSIGDSENGYPRDFQISSNIVGRVSIYPSTKD